MSKKFKFERSMDLRCVEIHSKDGTPVAYFRGEKADLSPLRYIVLTDLVIRELLPALEPYFSKFFAFEQGSNNGHR